MAAGDGLVSMTPSSIAHSGTSASINADGGVDFSAVTSLSLNGVFTSDYDNYLMVVNCTSTGNQAIRFRLRGSGSDASGSNYTQQGLQANGSGFNAGRLSSVNDPKLTEPFNTQRIGFQTHVYGPALAQPTAVRVVAANDESSASIIDSAITHSLSTAYDGVTVFINFLNITGTVHVFGYEE